MADVICCGCGDATGSWCGWTGDERETVLVEIMPQHLRESHERARNKGTYPANGAIRVQCSRKCARMLAEDDPTWTQIIEEG